MLLKLLLVGHKLVLQRLLLDMLLHFSQLLFLESFLPPIVPLSYCTAPSLLVSYRTMHVGSLWHGVMFTR